MSVQAMLSIDAVMRMAPTIPVLVIEDAADARPLAEALVMGGLRAIEVTLRTPEALAAIAAMSVVEGAIVGAGTVLDEAQLEAAAAAGARFIVSPGLSERLVHAAAHRGVPILPGVATASEVMRGLELGLTRFKFFPAETSGGAPALKSLAGPFSSARFCPTGGIDPSNAQAYLRLPNVVCVGGSWMCPPSAVRSGDWSRIVALAREAADFGQST